MSHYPRAISKVCIRNDHILCCEDNCTCTCHTDPVLVKYFRDKLREQFRISLANARNAHTQETA